MSSLISKLHNHPRLVTGVATAAAAATAYAVGASVVTAASVALVTAVALMALHRAKDWRTLQLSIASCAVAVITHIVNGPAKLELGAVALAIASLALGLFVWQFRSNKAVSEDSPQPTSNVDDVANLRGESKAAGKSQASSARVEDSAAVGSKTDDQLPLLQTVLLREGSFTIRGTEATACIRFNFNFIPEDCLLQVVSSDQDIEQLSNNLLSKVKKTADRGLQAVVKIAISNSGSASSTKRLSEPQIKSIWHNLCKISAWPETEYQKLQQVHLYFEDEATAVRCQSAVKLAEATPENSGSGGPNSDSGSSSGSASSEPISRLPEDSSGWAVGTRPSVNFGGVGTDTSSASSSAPAASSASPAVPLPQQQAMISIESKSYKLSDDTFVVAYFTDESQKQAFEKERGRNGKALFVPSLSLGWRWDTLEAHPQEQRKQRVDRILRNLEVSWDGANPTHLKIAFRIPKNTSLFIASKILEAFKEWLKKPGCKFTSVVLLYEDEEAQVAGFREGFQKLSLL